MYKSKRMPASDLSVTFFVSVISVIRGQIPLHELGSGWRWIPFGKSFFQPVMSFSVLQRSQPMASLLNAVGVL